MSLRKKKRRRTKRRRTKKRRKSLFKKKRTKKRRKSLFKKKRTKKRRRTRSGRGYDDDEGEEKQPAPTQPHATVRRNFSALRGMPHQSQEEYDELRELADNINNNPLNEIDGGYRRKTRSKRGGCGDC